MSDVVVGIDMGTGGARSVALDCDGNSRLWLYEEFDGAGSWPAGRADPGAWLEGLQRLLGRISAAGLKSAAIAIGGQSPTTVPLPSKAGSTVSSSGSTISGGLVPQLLVPPGLAVTCRHEAGNGLDRTSHHLAQFEVLKSEFGRDIRGAQIWDWALRCLGAGDLQGLWPGEEPIPGYGDAVMIGEVIGECDGALGAVAGTPLVSASNDAYMSFWAGGLGTPRRGHDPGGRTGGLGVAVDATQRPDALMGFFSPVAGVEVVGGPSNGHGQLLEWCARLTGRSIPELLALAADVSAGSDGVIVLPYHGGERAPRWEPRLRGEIHGLSFSTNAGELARAALESAAFGIRHIHEDLRDLGVAMDVMCCGGSPALSHLWCSIKASVVGVAVDKPERPEQLSAYGCALAAGSSVSWWDPVGAQDMASWPLMPMTRVEPDPDPIYDSAYERFVELGDAAMERLAPLKVEAP